MRCEFGRFRFKCSVVGCHNPATYREVNSRDGVYYCDKCRYTMDTQIQPLRETPEGKFLAMANEGIIPYMAMVNFFLAGNVFDALAIVCHGNNWQILASTMACTNSLPGFNESMFDFRVLKAKGFDHLREFVKGCLFGIWEDDLPLPNGYARLSQRLFESRGIKTPGSI